MQLIITVGTVRNVNKNFRPSRKSQASTKYLKTDGPILGIGTGTVLLMRLKTRDLLRLERIRIGGK